MGDVVEMFTKEERHATGEARCIDCRHEWVAVVPVSEYNEFGWLDCPSCGCHKGRFKQPFYFGTEHWICGCGNDLFQANRTHIYCPNCGREQNFT